MTDYFAALVEQRRPWIDPNALKAKFLGLSAEAHPDHTHNCSEAEKAAATQRYAELNAAYNCLREPKARLAHLLELELGRRPQDVQVIPRHLADLFVEVASLCRQTDTFLAGNRTVTSPLMQVKTFEEAQNWMEQLGGLQSRLDSQRDAITEELKDMNAVWTSACDPAARGPLLKRLEEFYRLLSYSARWSSQIKERIVQLSL